MEISLFFSSAPERTVWKHSTLAPTSLAEIGVAKEIKVLCPELLLK